MKELTATFQSEVFRPIVTLVIPGFYASATLSVASLQRFVKLRELIDSYPSASATVFLLGVITLGLILEEIGARIELYFDECLSKSPSFERHFDEWYEYLRLAFVAEPVGHRYLRTLVLRLKFELGMTVATVPFAAGAMFLKAPWIWRIVICAGALLLGTYLCFEAKHSDKGLSEVRRELLKRNWSEIAVPKS